MENHIFTGSSNGPERKPVNPEGDLKRFDGILSALVEDPASRAEAAAKILEIKNSITAAPDQLVQSFRDSAAVFAKMPSQDTFARTVAYGLAIAEPLLLGDGKKIQPEQVEAIVSAVSLHSTEVKQGQGKSNPIVPTAAVIRSILFDEQVHLTVINPQVRERDSENIRKLTDKLGMNVRTLAEAEGLGDDPGLLWRLHLGVTALDFVKSDIMDDSIRQKFKDTLNGKIHEITQRDKKRIIVHTLIPPKSQEGADRPDIVVGTDADFVFDRLQDPASPLWQGGRRCAMVLDGDLVLKKGTPYIIEAPSGDFMVRYLSDWIGAVAAHVKPEYPGEKFSVRFRRTVRTAARHGTIPQAYAGALRENLASVLSHLPDWTGRQLHSRDIRTPKKLIRQAAALLWDDLETKGTPGEKPAGVNTIAEYDWIRGELDRLTLGKDYQIDPAGRVILINPDTGHPLPSHKYQGLFGVMIAARQGVCDIHPQSGQTRASTGYGSFLREAYGPGRAVLMSGTLEPLADEVRFITGRPVIGIGRWAGENVFVPDIELSPTFDRALKRLLSLIGETQKPILVITENDQEVQFIRKKMIDRLPPDRRLTAVISLTGLEDETGAIHAAGQTGQITVANPRFVRDIDIVPSREANEAGGLTVVVWGTFHDRSVVEQALERTRRAGNPGQTHWMAYRSGRAGGHTALLDNPYVQKSAALQELIRSIPMGQVAADTDMTHELFDRYNEAVRAGRLTSLLRDTIRVDLERRLGERIQRSLRYIWGRSLASEEHVASLVRSAYGAWIAEFADTLSLDAAHFGGGDISTYAGLVRAHAGTLMHINRTLDEFVSSPQVKSMATRAYGRMLERREAHTVLSGASRRFEKENDRISTQLGRSVLVHARAKVPLRTDIYIPDHPYSLWAVEVSPVADAPEMMVISIRRTQFNKKHEVVDETNLQSLAEASPKGFRAFMIDMAQTLPLYERSIAKTFREMPQWLNQKKS